MGLSIALGLWYDISQSVGVIQMVVDRERLKRREWHSILIGCFVAAVVVGGGTYIWRKVSEEADAELQADQEDHLLKVSKLERMIRLVARKVKRTSGEFRDYVEHLKETPDGFSWQEKFFSIFRLKPTFASNDPTHRNIITFKVNEEKAQKFLTRMQKEHPDLKELAEVMARIFLSEDKQ